MEMFEKFKQAFRENEKQEVNPEIIKPRDFKDFMQTLEQEHAGVVCVYPWKIPIHKAENPNSKEYGLAYYSQSLRGEDIYFSETTGIAPIEEDLTLKNVVTAISRTEHFKDMLHIDSYVTTKDGYFADALDPAGYPMISNDAKEKGVEPWPLP